MLAGTPRLKSPLVLAALGTVALQVLCLVFFGSNPPGPALSQILQIVSAILAGLACFEASVRSSEFARSFWRLSAAAFLCWSAAQAFGTYRLFFAPPPIPSAAPSVILFFFSFAPLFATLFLSAGARDPGRRWESYLDFVQILIVTGTIYLLFLYSPWWQLTDQEWISRRATTVNLRNLLISAGFVLRALTARSREQRELYGRVGLPITLYSVGFWLGKRGVSLWSARQGSWFDLGWTVPFLLMTVLAETWEERREEKAQSEEMGLVPLLLAFLLTLSLPAVASGLLIFRGPLSNREVFLLSGAVAAVVICFFSRLLVTQFEQNRTFQLLHASERRYRSLFEHNTAGVFCTTPDGKYLDCNEAFARMLGYASREEVLASSSAAQYLSLEDRREQLDLLRLHKSSLNREVCRRRKDGTLLWALQNATLLEDEQGNEFIEGTLVDITERKRLEEELRQSQKMEAVGQLAGGVAHDFNNLLTVIQGYTRMLLDETTQSREEIHTSAEHIDSAAERAAALTRHLLAFSRKQVLQPRVIDLNALILNLDKMLRRIISEDIEIVTVPAANLGSMRADPGQMEQVILNLVVNARDAMPVGGKLTLETANVSIDENYSQSHYGMKAGRYVMLAVSDTGVGMDSQTMSRVFEPFFTTKEMGRGTGLGLSTVYGIVKQSGGYIWVYSEPGHGTTFKMYFSRVDDLPEVIRQAKTKAAPGRGNETILLVEDDEQVRELTRSVLAECGYSVLVAENAPAVVKICEQHSGTVDLLLTDVVMPGMGGREVAERVLARWNNAKVLYMSGYTENTIMHHGALDTGTFFLPKPFTPSILTAKVREVLGDAGESQ